MIDDSITEERRLGVRTIEAQTLSRGLWFTLSKSTRSPPVSRSWLFCKVSKYHGALTLVRDLVVARDANWPHTKSIELIVGVHLLLRIATIGNCGLWYT